MQATGRPPWLPRDFPQRGRRTRGIELFLGRFLVKARLQRRAGLETRVPRRGDFDFLAGRWIAPLSGRALAHGEGAESDQTHFLAFLQCFLDPLKQSLKRAGRVDLGQFRVRGDVIDELKLIHYGLSVRMRRSIVGAGSEVRRLQRLYDTATRATARSYSSLPLEGAHRRPQANRQQSSIHSSPFRPRNASVCRDGG